MKRRAREEEDEEGLGKGKKRLKEEDYADLLVKVSQLQEELKRVRPPQTAEENKSVPSLDRVVSQCTALLKSVLQEKGLIVKKVDDDLIQIYGFINYPNDIDLQQTQARIIEMDDGVACVTYDYSSHREMKIMITFTQNKALKMQYLAQDQREAQAFLSQVHDTTKNTDLNEAELLLFTLNSNVHIDKQYPPKVTFRTIGGMMQVVSVTVAVQSPLKNHQLENLMTRQSRKLKSLRLGAHPEKDTLRMIVEIYCSVPS